MDRRAAKELEAMIDAEFSSAESGSDVIHSSSSGEIPLQAGAQPGKRRVILVDAFNVLHAVLLGKEREHGWWRRAERERLLRRISTWESEPVEIWVAFDGAQPAWSVWAEPIVRPMTSRSPGPTVHSVFVESADDWIVRRARRARHPDQIVVVSADRKVAGRARSAGCEIWTPWAFISRCPLQPNRQHASDPDQSPGIQKPEQPQASLIDQSK